MTYGVPYSFVPGTKARADEVNANFIDVLSKIEDTNTKLEASNAKSAENLDTLSTQMETKFTEVEESLSGCTDLSLSNLNATGKAVLNAKADKSLLDGVWVRKSSTVLNKVAITKGSTKTVNLSSYLPADGGVYEVLFEAWGNLGNIVLTTDKIDTLCVFMGHAVYSTPGLFVVGSTRKVNFKDTVQGDGTVTVTLRAYRKAR